MLQLVGINERLLVQLIRVLDSLRFVVEKCEKLSMSNLYFEDLLWE